MKKVKATKKTVKAIYQTNSLPVAAYLRTIADNNEDLSFSGVNKDNPSMIFFRFEPEKTAKEYVDKFYAGSNESRLFENYRTLKDRVFDIRRNEKTVR